jgi:hypothetical protein
VDRPARRAGLLLAAAVFLGVALATIVAILPDGSPTLAVAVGTAAGMAAMTRLLFASLLFSALLVGTAGVDTIPAAVFAAAGVARERDARPAPGGHRSGRRAAATLLTPWPIGKGRACKARYGWSNPPGVFNARRSVARNGRPMCCLV